MLRNYIVAVLAAAAGSEFSVANEFIWETNADVVRRLVKADCGDLIASSVGCAQGIPRCGVCLHCIDRRLGIIAAGAESHDSGGNYRKDVFTGERPGNEDRVLIAKFVDRANTMSKLHDVGEMMANYPEALRAMDAIAGKQAAVGARILDLHRRHASEVNIAIERGFAGNAKALRERTLIRNCLLGLICDGESVGRANGASGTNRTDEVVRASGGGHERQETRWGRRLKEPDCHRLSKGHKVWLLVFEGREAGLAHERGIELINHLLKNPPEEPMHATELEARVDGGAIGEGVLDRMDGIGAPNVGGVIQEASGRKLSGGLGEILKRELAELREAEEDLTLPESEREAAGEEIQQLLSANAKGGRFIGAAGQSVDRVRKAIKGFISELKLAESGGGGPNSVLRDFGEHLERYLWAPSMGVKGRIGAVGRAGCFTYEAPAGVRWGE